VTAPEAAIDDHAPHGRQASEGDDTSSGTLPIWLRFLGLLTLLVPLFVGLQHLLEREETLAAEAALAAIPTPTPIIVEVPVTIERVVERTVFVPVPAPIEREAAPMASAPEQASQPAAEPREDPTTEATDEPPAAPAEEASATADPPAPAAAAPPIAPPPPFRRAPAWTPSYAAVVEPPEEEIEEAPPAAEEAPPSEEIAEVPAPPRQAEVVFESEIGPSYRGVQDVAIAAEQESEEAPPVHVAEQAEGDQDAIEGLAAAADGDIEPPASGSGEPPHDHEVSTPEPVPFETDE
jgi:hypothetical protein